MLDKFTLDKINGTKNARFFFHELHFITVLILIREFYYELKLKVHLFKSVCEIPIFDSISFLLKFIYFLNKKYGLFDFEK